MPTRTDSDDTDRVIGERHEVLAHLRLWASKGREEIRMTGSGDGSYDEGRDDALCALLDKLDSLQDGQATKCPACLGIGSMKIDEKCTCGGIDIGVGIMHEPTCGYDMCPKCEGRGTVV